MLPVILIHLWCIPNKLVLRKDTDIIHVAMGGGSKKFLHLSRGVQKVLAACEGGGQKSLTTKIFNCPAPHQSIYEHSLSDVNIYVRLCSSKFHNHKVEANLE